MSFEIVVSSDLAETASKFPEMLARALQKITMDLHGNLVKESPKDHGKLAGSWLAQRIASLYWSINSSTKYRFMVQTGTKPHEIRPKTKKALHFFSQGEEICCRVVHHPGTQANPYITRAIDKTETRIEEFVSKAIKEVLGGTA